MLRMDFAPLPPLDERFDFRYVIIQNPEPDSPSDLFLVQVLETYLGDDTGLLEAFTTDDPYRDVEAAREVQATPDIEQRWNDYAERGF